jgi:hypothetical protein
MARTDYDSVSEILPTATTLTETQVTAAITAANVLVTNMASRSCGSVLDDDTLTLIETYTAAHFCAVTENTLSLASEKDPACGGSATYGFQFGEGIKGTPFGQMANTLSGGCLAEFDKAPVNFVSIGSC